MEAMNGAIVFPLIGLIPLSVLAYFEIKRFRERRGPRPERLASWRRAGSDYILTVTWTDGLTREYRGLMAVWYAYPDGKECPEWLRGWLSDQWRVVRWAEEDAGKGGAE